MSSRSITKVPKRLLLVSAVSCRSCRPSNWGLTQTAASGRLRVGSPSASCERWSKGQRSCGRNWRDKSAVGSSRRARARPSTSYYVDVKSRTHKSSYFLMTFLPPDQRETGCYAWHGTKAVTLTWDAPLSKALGPGLSVSKLEP